MNPIQTESLTIQDIVRVRKASDIKQYELAELLGIPIGTWSNVEKGRAIFYSDVRAKAVKILQDLGADFNVLNEEEEPMPERIPVEVKQESKDDLFNRIALEIANTLSRKNHDYGDSFHDVYKEFGDMSTYIRLKDKLGRLKTLVEGKKAQVKDEPIEDVFRDIAGYCILTLTSKERLKEDN